MPDGNAAELGGAASLIDRLEQVLGRENVLSDVESRKFFSTDLSWRPGETAAAVTCPRSIPKSPRCISSRAWCSLTRSARAST